MYYLNSVLIFNSSFWNYFGVNGMGVKGRGNTLALAGVFLEVRSWKEFHVEL